MNPLEKPGELMFGIGFAILLLGVIAGIDSLFLAGVAGTLVVLGFTFIADFWR